MKKLFTILLVLGCAALMSTPAMAAPCVPDDATHFCLDTPNATGGDAITVQVTLVGTSLTVAIADDAGNSSLKITTVGIFNTNGNLFDPNNLPSGWSTPDSCCDGFSFDGVGGPDIPESSAGNPQGGTSVTFTLLAPPVFGDGGPLFAVHVQGLDNRCSIWLTNGTPDSQGQVDPECGGTEVPEPGSLALLGTGLFSAVGVLRRKLKKA